jgi:hypothetical protein
MPGTGIDVMSDASLVRDPEPNARPASRGRIIAIAAVAAVLLAAIAGGAWWYVKGRQAVPDWARVPDLNMSAPAGDAFQEGTPWVRLQLVPARPNDVNTVRVSLHTRQGTPVAGEAGGASIASVTAQSLTGPANPETVALDPEPGTDGAFLASAQFSAPGWWRIAVEVSGAEAPAEFFLLFPDPNINGPGAVARSNASAEGDALYQRGMSAITSLHSVRFTQWLSDGRGNAAVSEHAVTAGGDGEPAGFTYRAAGGMEAVIIDSTRWVLLKGELGWTRQEGAVSVPPSEWGEEYTGATGFTILGEETVDGEPCQILAFVVPEIVEPRRQTAAWYLWWVGKETGHVHEEAMVSRVHYMHNTFSGFDEPIELQPPAMAATPVAGTATP